MCLQPAMLIIRLLNIAQLLAQHRSSHMMLIVRACSAQLRSCFRLADCTHLNIQIHPSLTRHG